ncbi:MAG: hypothetical protein HY660_13270 [Armatimonadetes bacterium]|nr:hypothetical protein [Armatimonadota bacterium]
MFTRRFLAALFLGLTLLLIPTLTTTAMAQTADVSIGSGGPDIGPMGFEGGD